MGLGDQFIYTTYTSDDGTDYIVKLSQEVATKGGFGAEVSPKSGKVWPFGRKNMRHVYGVTADGLHRTVLPCGTPGNATYVSGTSFPLHGRDYIAEGAIGEKRKYNSVA